MLSQPTDRLNYLEAGLSRISGLLIDAGLHLEGANDELKWRVENMALTVRCIRDGSQDLTDEMAARTEAAQ